MYCERTFKSFLCFGLLLLVLSCDNDAFGPYWGKASANKDGAEWKGEIRGIQLNDLMALTMHRLTPEGYLREDLYISSIPKEVGVHTIPQTDTLRTYQFVTAKYFTFEDDGDVIEGVYYVDASADNFIEIESIKRGVYKGTFQVRLFVLPDSKASFPYLPDTVSFTNGKFKTKILLKN